MPRQVRAKEGGYAVEAAIREGKIPESRRAHYMKLMAKNPKKTARLLARLAAVLPPPDTDAAVDMSNLREFHAEAGRAEGRFAEEESEQGPTAYPKAWLGATAATRPGQPSRRDPITIENPVVAAECMPGANVPEGLG